MTQWRIIRGEILDTVADGLICSANPSLNLSGGVGGAFALRFGNEMQSYLHEHLARLPSRSMPPGSAVIAPPCGSSYRAVAHAVAIDAFYDTSAEMILAAYKSAIQGLTAAGCRSIAAACLACGYGRFPPNQFAEAIRPLVMTPIAAVDSFTLVSTRDEVCQAVENVLIASCLRPD